MQQDCSLYHNLSVTNSETSLRFLDFITMLNPFVSLHYPSMERCVDSSLTKAIPGQNWLWFAACWISPAVPQ